VYQLPRIYDYFLSAADTPGGQSFGRRQQRLPKRQQNYKRLQFDQFIVTYYDDASFLLSAVF